MLWPCVVRLWMYAEEFGDDRGTLAYGATPMGPGEIHCTGMFPASDSDGDDITPERLVEALVEWGWLDRVDEDTVILHDWESRGGMRKPRTNTDRTYDAERQRRSRSQRAASQHVTGSHIQSQVVTDGHGVSHHESRVEIEKKAEATADTPDSVVPKVSLPLPHSSVVPPPREDKSGNGGGADGEKPNNGHNDRVLKDFERFWRAYPKHSKRQIALQTFISLDLTTELAEAIVRGAEAVARSPDAQREGGRFIRSPDRWLSEQGWDDDVQPLGAIRPGRPPHPGSHREGLDEHGRECGGCVTWRMEHGA